MTAVSTIRMGFIEAEDRLLIDFVYPDEVVSLQATRRITRRMIHGLAQVLAESSAVAKRVPHSHKIEMLVFEHLSALQPTSGPAGDGVPATQDHAQQPWPLLQQLHVVPQPSSFSLRFTSAIGGDVAMEVSREELHRMVATFRQLARHAEWDIDAAIPWLIEADSPLPAPGRLLS